MSESPKIDLPQGTLDLLILKSLSLEPQHGWAISDCIQTSRRAAAQGSRIALSGAAFRSSRKGSIKAEWGASENNRKAKFYALTRSAQSSSTRRPARGAHSPPPWPCCSTRHEAVAMLADLTHRLRALFRRDAVERELDEELRLHLEHEIDKRVAAGMPRDEAARQARLAVGGFDQIKEAHRDARGVRAIESILQDLRYGARTLRRTPLFAVTSVMTLALSTAALATVLTLAHTLFVRRLPVPRAEEVVAVSGTRIRWNPDRVAVRDAKRLRILGPVSYPDYVSFRDRATTVTGLAAHYLALDRCSSAPMATSEKSTALSFRRTSSGCSASSRCRGRFFTMSSIGASIRDRVAANQRNLW